MEWIRPDNITDTDNNAEDSTPGASIQRGVAGATCHALVPNFSAGVVASDCNGPVVVTQTPAAGTSVGLCVTPITPHFKHVANNEPFRSATFTVTDTTPPAITSCATNRSASAGANCQAAVPDFTVGIV